jgi:hypothetical protein
MHPKDFVILSTIKRQREREREREREICVKTKKLILTQMDCVLN